MISFYPYILFLLIYVHVIYADTSTNTCSCNQTQTNGYYVAQDDPILYNAQCPCYDNTQQHILFVIDTPTQLYRGRGINAGALRAAADCYLTLDFYAPPETNSYFVESTLQTALASKTPPTGIVASITSLDAKSDIIKLLNQAVSRNITVVTVNSAEQLYMNHSDAVSNFRAHIGMDQYQSGWDAAMKSLQSNPQSAYTVCITETTDQLVTNERCQGWYDGMKLYHNITLHDQFAVGLDLHGGAVDFILMLQSWYLNLHPSIQISPTQKLPKSQQPYQSVVVLCVSEYVANTVLFGWQTYVSIIGWEMNMDLVVVAYDASPYTVDAMENGNISLIADTQPYLQGYLAVQLTQLFTRTTSDLNTKFLRTGPIWHTRTTDGLRVHAQQENAGFPRCPSTDYPDICTDYSGLDMHSITHIPEKSNWGALLRSGIMAAGRDTQTVIKDHVMVIDLYTTQDQFVNDLLDASPRTVSGIYFSVKDGKLQHATLEDTLQQKVPLFLVNNGINQIYDLQGPSGWVGSVDGPASALITQKFRSVNATRCLCLRNGNGNGGNDRCALFALEWNSHHPTYNATIVELQYFDITSFRTTLLALLAATPYDCVLSIVNEMIDYCLDALAIFHANSTRVIHYGTYDSTENLFTAIQQGQALFGIDQNTYIQGWLPMIMLILQAATGGWTYGNRLVADPALSLEFNTTFPVVLSGPTLISSYSNITARCGQANVGTWNPTWGDTKTLDLSIFPFQPYAWPVCDRVWVPYAAPSDPVESFSPGLVIATYVLAGIFTTISLLLFIFVATHLHSQVILAASPPFLLLLIASCSGMYISIILYVLPVNAAICNCRWWIPALCLTTILAVCVAKTYRIYRIFLGSTLKSAAPTTASLARLIIICLLITTFILIVASISSPPAPIQLHMSDGTIISSTTSCSFHYAYAILIIVYIGILLTIGCYLSIKVRNAPSLFNESRRIGVTIYSTIFCACILIPLNYLLTSPDSLVIIRVFGILLGTSMIIFPLVLPVIWTHYHEKRKSALKLQQQQQNQQNPGDAVLSVVSNSHAQHHQPSLNPNSSCVIKSPPTSSCFPALPDIATAHITGDKTTTTTTPTITSSPQQIPQRSHNISPHKIDSCYELESEDEDKDTLPSFHEEPGRISHEISIPTSWLQTMYSISPQHSSHLSSISAEHSSLTLDHLSREQLYSLINMMQSQLNEKSKID